MPYSIEFHWNQFGRPCDPTAQDCMPHVMSALETDAGFTIALLVRKKNTSQTLRLYVPGRIDDFLRTWRQTGWNEVDKHEEGGVFTAIRYVEYLAGMAVVWKVDHRNGVPHDELRLFSGSLESMRELYARDRS